ncbi:MAG: hypothetical protein PVF43_03835 [Candidatus Eiseniibacteriota bacterium]|jgi:hypothetical protein
MNPHRLVAVLVLAATLSISAGTSMAREPGTVGVGVYQALGIRTTPAYPTLSVWVAPLFMMEFGFDFSTSDAENYGFLTRDGLVIYQRGNADVLIGGVLELFEVAGRSFTGFAPFGSVQYAVTSELTLKLDAFPFEIGHVNDNTEASFLQGRIGATYWFN